MSIIRILNLNVSNFRSGGRSKIVYHLGMNIDENKFVYDYFAPSKKNIGLIDDYLHKIKSQNGKYFDTVKGRVKSENIVMKQISYFYTLRSILKTNKYKIVHIHASQGFEALRSVVISKLYKVPIVIVHAHNAGMEAGSFYQIRKIIHNLSKTLLKNFDIKKFACSTTASQWIFGKDDAIIIKNGINVEKFKFDESRRNEFRKKYGLEKCFVVGNIGRFFYQKNHNFLIEIFAEIVKRKENSRLLLIGEGHLEKAIKKKIEGLGLQKHVVFFGNRTDIPDCLLGMDVFALTSFYEGLGIVNLEAQASGLPTVISDTIPKEVKCTNLVEFVSLQKSPEYWAEIILSYYNGPNRFDRIKEVMNSGYDIQKSVKQLEKAYIDYVKEKF